MEFKKSSSTTGKFKNVQIVNGTLVDYETGEIISLLDILERVYGDDVFSITTTQKSDSDVTPEDGDE